MSRRRQFTQSMLGIPATGALGLSLASHAQSTPDLAKILLGFSPGGPKRSPFTPNVPTLQEQGIDLAVREWFASSGQAKRPPTCRPRSTPKTSWTARPTSAWRSSLPPGHVGGWLKEDANTWLGIVQQVGFKADT